MKKLLIIPILLLGIILFTGCDKETEALKFKNDYESINGQENASGKIHRVVTIDPENPFIEVSASDIVNKLKNKETFYVYFGSRLCPWCRSVIEKAIEEARKNNIKEIYYVDIWDDEGKEILRDKYTLDDNNELVLSIEAGEGYQELLEYFAELLSEYTLKDKDGKSVSTGEKRIYAPNFFYIEEGKALKMTEGISSLQKDSREELSEEMLKEEEELFKEFFDTGVCVEQGC